MAHGHDDHHETPEPEVPTGPGNEGGLLTKLRSKVMKDNWRHRREAAAAAARRGSV